MPEKNIISSKLTLQIVAALLLGIVAGLCIRYFFTNAFTTDYIVNGVLDVVGRLFIVSMQMLVVPIVFVSLICGVTQLTNLKQLGRMGLKTFVLYLFTTAIAIAIALVVASAFGVGKSSVNIDVAQHIAPQAPSLKQVITDLLPTNPFRALHEGNMLQIIFFAILLGIAIIKSGKPGEAVADFFENMNVVVMKLITMIIQVAPYGVFALITKLFAETGFALIQQLALYFVTVLFVLLLQLMLTYPIFLSLLARLNPWVFLRKLLSLMVFAFSTSSSSATLPVTLNTVEKKLGVKNSIASFVIPLGATINMDGTAIMQGVATVFIANVYNVHLGVIDFLTVIAMATLASIGTAGVPGVGLITLMMVLKQVGLPAEGIALIIGVDRLLDMARTAVNVTGDTMVACIVGKSEKALDEQVFYDRDNEQTEPAKP